MTSVRSSEERYHPTAERVYQGDGIEVSWEPSRCIHFAACVRGSVAAFNPRRRPWIDLGAEPAEKIAEIVSHCPTGALHARWADGTPAETVPDAFDASKYGELSAEPWLDVTLPAVLDPDLAPPGAHVASIYVHCAPYRLRDGDWAHGRDLLLERTLRVLERVAPGMGSLIVGVQVITPADLERDHGFTGGHIFHGELAPDQLFTMRPFIGCGRYRSPIAGLYLGGGGTHPGGFLTGASGRLAAAEIANVKSAAG